jgi:hypothetical protein
MDLLTLYHLLNDLTDEKCHLEATVLLTEDPARQSDLEQRVRHLSPLLAEIRGEILARELPGARSTVTAQEFETHVHRVLKAYASMKPMHREATRLTA